MGLDGQVADRRVEEGQDHLGHVPHGAGDGGDGLQQVVVAQLRLEIGPGVFHVPVEQGGQSGHEVFSSTSVVVVWPGSTDTRTPATGW